jgi:hypothetical protein
MNQIKKQLLRYLNNTQPQKSYLYPDEQAFLKEDRARMHNKDYQTVKRSDVIEAPKKALQLKPQLN